MECNKEEAIRAKGMAEKRMQDGDFTGAQKFALKAQRLFPELENISQLITVCDVHCSAQSRLNGSEMDWYSILQIERMADEGTIKKQYRKLALLLHPDKNKFTGAEAAFKLIGEANRVLTNPTTRAQYDLKFRASVRTATPKPPVNQSHKNNVPNKQYGATNNFPNVTPSQFSAPYPHQRPPQMAFWTCCQFCGMRYQYYREHVNKVLRCQNCLNSFTAYDLGAHVVPPGSSWSQLPTQKEFSNMHSFKVSLQNNGGKPSGLHHVGRFAELDPALKPGSKPEVSRASSTKEKVGGKNMGCGNSGAGMPRPDAAKLKSDVTKPKPDTTESTLHATKVKPDAKKAKPDATKAKPDAAKTKPHTTKSKPDTAEPKLDATKTKPDAAKPCELGCSRTTSRKRKKSMEESSESFETGDCDEIDDVVVQENGGNIGGANHVLNELHQRRRSLRQKQEVSYNENLSDDDIVSPPLKRSRESRPSIASKEEMKEAAVVGGLSGNDKLVSLAASVGTCKQEVRENESATFEENLPSKKRKTGESKANAEDDDDEKRSKVDGDTTSDADISLDREVFEYPDPDFSDFDKDKVFDCFAVNQVWAIYDTTDGMPRFYARIKKVFSYVSKLQITWLEPDSDNQDEQKWTDVELPVACGKYVNGGSEETEDLLMFSHQIHCTRGSTRGSYFVYPRKGETWALFKDWDVSWSSEPEKHKPPYQYEFVEVLSDFVDNVGIGVTYLGKMKGFVSIFQQTEQHGIVSFQIPPGEIYRFSHRIPSFRMTGKEGEGVPVGSFELDPASLPTNLDEHGDTGDLKMEKQSPDIEEDSSHLKSPKSDAKTMTGLGSVHTPKKHENCNHEREAFRPRRSPRESNGIGKCNGQVYGSQCLNQGDGSKDGSYSDISQHKGNFILSQVDEKVNTPNRNQKTDLPADTLKLRRSPRDLSKHVDNKTSSSVTKSPSVSASASSGQRITEEKSFDFWVEKSEEKFQIDQIWALYKEKDGMPKDYAQVKKIESTPDFRLHVALLEACTLPKDTINPVCCGLFKVKNGKTKVVSRSVISHQLQAEDVGKSKYEIYPRKGQVWALYKNWNSESGCSNLGECDIVEVLEDNNQGTKLVVLTCISRSKALYRAPRSQRLKTAVIDIPRGEFGRFSHQIPAFQHTGEKDRLRGFWELDPSAIPGIIILD